MITNNFFKNIMIFSLIIHSYIYFIFKISSKPKEIISKNYSVNKKSILLDQLEREKCLKRI